MTGFGSKFISLADLYLAYRKAKADSFFDNAHPSALAYTEYEQKLEQNLKNLLGKIIKKPIWMYDNNFLGGYNYVPKSIDDSKWQIKNSDRIHYRAIDPIEDWKTQFETYGSEKISAKYRLTIKPSVNFQIISALWILKVGHLFERKLDQNVSYGNRLRRFKKGTSLHSHSSGDLNTDSLGLFQPYFSAYKRWRENGLRAMQDSLINGKSINAITMDVSSFYHKVSPKFLLRSKFLDQIGVDLDINQIKFTSHIIKAIDVWYSNTPDFLPRPQGGLPVGLSASKVISNVLLNQFDKEMVGSLCPIYYGRYVDDIFLVINAPQDAHDGDEVLKWIQDKVPCVEKQDDGTLKLNYEYAEDSEIIFAREKQKIFCLSSTHGLDLVDQIFNQIRKQSSEYRMLPDVPDTAPEMASRTLLAASSASLEADSLRKADVVSVRRLGFSLLLGDIESYSRALGANEWTKVRSQFYGLVHRHLLTPKGLFEFQGYFSRVFSLMIGSGDFEDANSFISGIDNCFKILRETTDDGTKDQEKVKSCWHYFVTVLIQSALQASSGRTFSDWTKLLWLLKQLMNTDPAFDTKLTKKVLMDRSNELLLSDLGKMPYKEYWYYSQREDINKVSVPKARDIRKVLRLAAIRSFRKAAELKLPHWPALAFPTRPLTIQEIALISPKVLDDDLLFKRVIRGLRGAGIGDDHSIGFKIISEERKCKILSVPRKWRTPGKVKIALTSLKTEESQWLSSVKGNPDRSLLRYRTIYNLINSILREKDKPDYVILPECSIPRKWAFVVAQKLAQNGISFICGLEYYTDKLKTRLRNDSLISLVTYWPGYLSNIIYTQAKLEPSHGEREKLKQNKKQQFCPKVDVELSLCGNIMCKQYQQELLPIYDHGGFFFGVLICSDLTNIENRSHFQGKVDSLFVLEWNPDVDTFSFLVEGAAHDIHTYVIQVNNRKYGDSRIRAPFKEAYSRDSIRIKGGICDFYVIGDVDYASLRKFQLLKRTPPKPLFKPLPIGFKIASWRKVIPLP